MHNLLQQKGADIVKQQEEGVEDKIIIFEDSFCHDVSDFPPNQINNKLLYMYLPQICFNIIIVRIINVALP